MQVFHGHIVHSLGVNLPTEILEDTVIGFQKKCYGGKILFVEKASALGELAVKFGFEMDSVVHLTPSQFLMPGLVDTHLHAPQYVNSGIGYDKKLLDWLDVYTFPTEARCSDVDYARNVYTKAVRRGLLHGTTTACYFATIHLEATKELCRVIEKLGQRALVGKVCMDQQSPDYYIEETQQSIQDTRRFVDFVLSMKNPLIGPVITPRFPLSCSVPLLRGLGELAEEYSLPVQSHLCEQKEEIAYTKSIFPQHRHLTHIFEEAKLLTNKTLMAHCIYLEEEELTVLQARGVAVSHCPMSNFNVRSGSLDVRKLLHRGMKLGLGTDVSGGHSSSILAAMRSSIDTARAVSFTRQEVDGEDDCYGIISHHHAFHLATLGGAAVLSMEDRIGNFQVGKEFDALLIDVLAPDPDTPVFDIFEPTSFEDILMKFLYLGDDRNIVKRFIAGQEIHL